MTENIEETELGFKDDGSPTLATLSNAVQCWSVLNEAASPRKSITVGDAALSFCLSPERIAAAVEQHYWMFLTGAGPLETRTIEHEGE